MKEIIGDYGEPFMNEKTNISPHFQVTMLPRLTVSDGTNMIDEDTIRSDMVVRLFAYLILNHGKNCSSEELADALWPDDESVNPIGALKNLTYRLRTVLKKEWPDIEIIKTGRGSYRWNPSLPVVTDTDIFAAEYQKAEHETDPDRKIVHFRKAFDIYKGRFMMSLSDDRWVITKAVSFESNYLSAARELTRLLGEKGNFQEMEKVAIDALEIEPYDEKLHMALIRSYIGQNRPNEAEAHYRATTRILYDSLGIGPSKELQGLLESVMEQEHKQETDLAVIQQELHEATHPKGAYFCEYGFFKKVYELEARRVARMGMTIYLSLITVYTSKRVEEQNDKDRARVEKAMIQLYDTVMDSLRLGDVFTRYSANQYLIMLPACPYENAKMVMERILRNYEKVRRHARVHIQYALKEMDQNDRGSHGNPVAQPSTLRIMIDRIEENQKGISGRIAGIALEEEYSFGSSAEFLLLIERLLNTIGKPQPGRIPRNFSGNESILSYNPAPEIVRDVGEVMKLFGKAGTWNAEFRSRSYNTWQGLCYNAESDDAPAAFASELELVNMICMGSDDPER